ncbi:MAG: hypothetical protein JNJ83_22535 [Verrucomicrobiaceae bacterium]|nr:hypothetical protein [Verrucomicrobiaceae bacterium]
MDITDYQAGPVNDPSFARALVLKSGDRTTALVAVDAVAIGGIGRIGNGFLATVRGQVEKDCGIPAEAIIINASHCHAVVRADTAQLVVKAITTAASQLTPLKAGTGTGNEDRISENRRMTLKDGSQVDMRRAYSMPPDDQVASVGPIDPEIGLLKLERTDGTPFAVVYQFACHPIMNPPSKGNSADYPGFASKAIEEALGHETMALFLQGCGGDINPIRYKEPTRPADAEPLGAMLATKVLSALQNVKTQPSQLLQVERTQLSLPRAADYDTRIAAIEVSQKKLLASLKPTNINFKSFLPLLIQHKLYPEMPSHYAQGYLHDKASDRKSIEQLDADNKALVEAYLGNIQVMEELTRLNTNQALLKRHREETLAANSNSLSVEVCGLRVGDFKLVTFPGEITVQVGLNIKKAAAQKHSFVSGYTNGYIYYTPTVAQRANTGYAQEDCDTLVAPEWQQLFEARAVEVLKRLAQ